MRIRLSSIDLIIYLMDVNIICLDQLLLGAPEEAIAVVGGRKNVVALVEVAVRFVFSFNEWFKK